MQRWLLSIHAKKIGTLYLVFGALSGMLGTAFSMGIRAELANLGTQVLGADHQLYNAVISAHTILMVFYLVAPILLGGFGAHILPVQPELLNKAPLQLSTLSFWLLSVGTGLLLLDLLVLAGATALMLDMPVAGTVLCTAAGSAAAYGGLSHSPSGESFALFRKEYEKWKGHALSVSDTQLSVLVGFFEGDGCAWSSLAGVVSDKLIWSIDQKDPLLLNLMQSWLGIGNVTGPNARGQYKWRISSQEEIRLIILLLNGNLRLPVRLDQMKRFVAMFNHIVAKRGFISPVVFIPTLIQVDLVTGWLSGIIDAEGCFSVSVFPLSFSVTWSLTQARLANVPVMQHIADLVGATLGPHRSTPDCWVAKIGSLWAWTPGHPLLLYLEHFPLHSTKAKALASFRYLVWARQANEGNSKDLYRRFELWTVAATMNPVKYRERMLMFSRWEAALGRDLPRAPGF